MTQSQKEFEAWADGKYILHKSSINGKYMTVLTNHAWESWQASRAALVVELPKQPDDTWGAMPYERGQIDGMNVMLEDCQSALDKAGVSYK